MNCTKKCSSCKEVKYFTEFYDYKKSKDGKKGQCKSCEALYREKVRATTEYFNYKKCSTCKIEKTAEYFSKNKSQKDNHCNVCKECVKNSNKNNSKNIQKRNSEYRKLNRNSILESRRNIYHTILKKDVLYVLHTRLSNSIVYGLKSKNKNSKAKNTEVILGCTFQEFKEHIEKQFLNWMSWENYGNACETLEPNCSWDLDHIIPLSQAKTEEEIYMLNHWSNFQPLCSFKNRNIKRDNIYPLTNLELNITNN